MSEQKKALQEKVARLNAMLDAAKKLNIKGLGKGKGRGGSKKG